MSWVSRIADWTPYSDPDCGHWNGTAWELTEDYSALGQIILDATGQAWAEGYRPTRLRVTADITTIDPTFNIIVDLYGASYDLIGEVTFTGLSGSYEHVIDVSGQSVDIVLFGFGCTSENATDLKVTGIEFTEDFPESPHVYGVAEIESECIGDGIGVGTISRDGVAEIEVDCLGGVFLPATGTAEIEAEAIADITALPPTLAKFITRTQYFFTITDTDTAEVFTLPASSLSISSRSGNQSSINAVVPFTVEYAAIVSAITHGVMKIYRAQTDNTGATNAALIEHGALTGVQSDIGPKNASIILTGTSTKTNRAAKFVELNGLAYVATVNGKKRVRCTPSNDLTVGDTVSIEGHVLIANNIQLNVTESMETMEVYE